MTEDVSLTQSRQRLFAVRERLLGLFVGRAEAIDAMLYGAVADQPILFVGRPGTAKSRIILTFCEALGLERSGGTSGGQTFFQYLLTEFTVPEELFGYPDLARFQRDGQLERADAGMMQQATVIFLDEVLNASSSLLNSLLSMLNERVFFDRGQRRPAPYRIFLGATQEPPTRPELLALYDRFTVRVGTDWVDERDQLAMVHRALGHGQRVEGMASLEDLEIVARACRARLLTERDALSSGQDEGMMKFLRIVRYLRDRGVAISDRRMVNLLRVLVARSVLEERPAFEPDGLWLLRYALTDPMDAALLDLLHRAVFYDEGGA